MLEPHRPKTSRKTKEAPVVLLLLILFSDLGFNWLYARVLKDAFSIAGFYTEGVIDALFVLSLLKIAFIVYGIIFWIGRFKRAHLGMGWKNFKKGVLVVFVVWGLMEFIQIAYSMFTGRELGYLNQWQGTGAFMIVSGFLTYVVGKALFDEITYRSLLMPQLHLKLRKYINLDDRATLALAVLIIQPIYLFSQIPLIGELASPGAGSTAVMASLLLLSILNSLIYLRTRNLYIVAGMHALWYHPIFVAAPSIPHLFVLSMLAIGLIIIWPMLPNSPSLIAIWPLERRSS